MNIENIIKEAQELLLNNSEWKNRYKGYADNLLANIDVIKSNRRRFNEFPPLYFYISTTNAKNAKTKLLLDVRYRGQSVATLKANKNSITISTKEQDDKNLRDFNCTIKLNDIPWQETQVSEFRKFFKNRDNSRNYDDKNKKNEEHNVENLLLSEFSKRISNNKQITGIQPVKICGNRFGMPTPISASDHKALKYANQYGGGIDIFARTGRGLATYLTVIEVKDENNSKEPPEDALKQSIQYAVFIRELLRSDCGENWYKIFGFNGAIPKNLTIRAVCAMPNDNSDQSFAKQTYLIGVDKIECHYIYFKYDGKQLSDFQTSL
jgi:hypothetical protein